MRMWLSAWVKEADAMGIGYVDVEEKVLDQLVCHVVSGGHHSGDPFEERLILQLGTNMKITIGNHTLREGDCRNGVHIHYS